MRLDETGQDLHVGLEESGIHGHVESVRSGGSSGHASHRDVTSVQGIVISPGVTGSDLGTDELLHFVGRVPSV